jgi:L-ascorbate metabolism protein UlaG (beta-lactamase superfamily)
MSTSHRFYPSIDKHKRFANYRGEKHESVFWRSLFMCLQAWLHSHRGYEEQLATWMTMPTLSQVLPTPGVSFMQPKITWIGHSTFLIQIGDVNIITDPVFFNLPLFRRITPPGLALHELPPIHAVLISHNHYDHMEEASLRVLFGHKECVFFVPLGDKAWFEKRGCSRVVECMWWDRQPLSIPSLATKIMFTFLPAFHWSQRGVFDRNTSLWGSWMIEAALQDDASIQDQWRIYFGGDSAYGRHYKAIAQEFSLIDIALLPIGPCEPRKWMKYSHLGPEEAGRAFLDLGARHFIPMHWATYWFGIDTPLMPIEKLHAWWSVHRQELADGVLHSLKIGQTQSFMRDQQTTQDGTPRELSQ